MSRGTACAPWLRWISANRRAISQQVEYLGFDAAGGPTLLIELRHPSGPAHDPRQTIAAFVRDTGLDTLGIIERGPVIPLVGEPARRSMYTLNATTPHGTDVHLLVVADEQPAMPEVFR